MEPTRKLGGTPSHQRKYRHNFTKATEKRYNYITNNVFGLLNGDVMKFLITYMDCDSVYHTVYVRGWIKLLYVRAVLWLTWCIHTGTKPIF